MNDLLQLGIGIAIGVSLALAFLPWYRRRVAARSMKYDERTRTLTISSQLPTLGSGVQIVMRKNADDYETAFFPTVEMMTSTADFAPPSSDDLRDAAIIKAMLQGPGGAEHLPEKPSA